MPGRHQLELDRLRAWLGGAARRRGAWRCVRRGRLVAAVVRVGGAVPSCCRSPTSTGRPRRPPARRRSISPRRDQRPAAAAPRRARGPSGRDRAQLVVGRALVAALELVDQQAGVEPEEVAVGAQEALDVDLAREQVPLLVLDRAQVLGADLRPRLDLVDVDPARASAPPAGSAPMSAIGSKATVAALDAAKQSRKAVERRDRRPAAVVGLGVAGAGAGRHRGRRRGGRRPRPGATRIRGTSASVISTWRGLEPS